jgi:hypothetical protein
VACKGRKASRQGVPFPAQPGEIHQRSLSGRVPPISQAHDAECPDPMLPLYASPRGTSLRNGFGETGFEATRAGTNRVAMLPSWQPVGFSFQRPDSDSKHNGIPVPRAGRNEADGLPRARRLVQVILRRLPECDATLDLKCAAMEPRPEKHYRPPPARALPSSCSTLDNGSGRCDGVTSIIRTAKSRS